MKISLAKLFLIFVKIGTILLGGGYVILPILRAEFVEKYKLITEEELVEYFAISQSLPGIIAANISIFVGYKLHRTLGAIVARLGVNLSPFLCIVLLATLISTFVDAAIMQGLFWGIGIGVIILLISATKEMWSKSVTDKFSLLLFSVALFTLLTTSISPVIVVIFSAISGILFKTLTNRRRDA